MGLKMVIETWTKRDRKGIYSTEVDINIVGDFIVACSYCHIPCSGIYRFWYKTSNGQLCLIQVDQPTFDDLMDELLTEYCEQDKYMELPLFIRQYNESVYWADVDACYTGSRIDKTDFVQMLLMMMQLPNNTTHIVQLLQSLMALVKEADLYQQDLLVLDD